MEGVRASNRDKSGVIVREIEPCWVRREFIELPEGGIPGVVGLGVDQENAEVILKISVIEILQALLTSGKATSQKSSCSTHLIPNSKTPSIKSSTYLAWIASNSPWDV